MHKFSTLFLTAVLAMPVTFGQAQEFSSRGNLSAEVNWTSLNNLIGRNKGEIDVLRTDLDAMKGCSAKGMLHAPESPNKDANGCVGIISPNMVVQIEASSKVIPGKGQHASYATATCPEGTVLIACMGSRTPDFTDNCMEEDCGLVGAGPYNANTCITTIDDGQDTRATAWATCLKTSF